MKSFTDLEQSKKLAEFLSSESADMHYNNGSCRGVDYTEHFSAELMPYQEALYLMKIHKTNFMFQVIPCWSSTALLEVIRNNGRYELQMYEGGYYFEANGFMTESYFNPVDACYDLILKLHELNLL